MDILVFAVDTHRYALPARDVDQVVRAVTITPLPGAPLVVEGVIDVHGTLVPVLDLRRRFGLPAQAPALSDLLIIASAPSRRVALRVGDSASILKIDPASLDRSGESLTQSPWVAGLAKLSDGIVVIHDLALFLSESESESLAKALADKTPLRVA
ncbi:MAG TPA: chemotaxis protein CheW [Gemmatimonadaceae bacterium]|nr:chemotaxis protein CheW [Gemmatimonadaceae bacterium]